MKNKLQILTIALVTLIFTNGYSATKTWTGGSSSRWTTSGNWSGGVPASGDDVIIPASLSNYPNDRVNGTIKSLTINGGSVTLQGGDLTISTSLTLSGGGINLNGRTLTVPSPTLTSGSITSTNNASILVISGTHSASLIPALSNGLIRYTNLTISTNRSLNQTTEVSGTLTLNGGNLNLNGFRLTTTSTSISPVLTSGSITSTNANSYLDISTTTFTNSLISLTAGWVEYNNLTIANSQTVTNSTLITGILRLNSGANLNLNGKYVDLLNENIDVMGDATITGTSLQKLNAWNGTLDIDGGTLTLNNVEVVIQHLDFTNAHDIIASNGGFLSFDNQVDHNINGNSPGVATNTAHVNAKVRLYTRNGNSDIFNFPIGDGSVYSPFIFDPTSVTGTDSFGQWVEVTYTGAKASQETLDGSTLKAASGYEYWTVASSHTTLTGTVALRYDNNGTKTGKTVLSSGSNTNNLILAQFNNSSSKWVGIGASPNTTNSITTSTSSSSVNPTSKWTIGSNTTGTGFLVALPVTLINFDAVANKTNKTVDVRWATASEENNSHFEIMHSTDFVNWTSIGTVYSQGNGNEMNVYSFTDINPSNVNQYKLKIVALNGEVSYTSIKLVKFTETISTTVSIYPNPANSNVNLSVDNMDMSTPVTIQLMNPMGQVVFEQIITENISGMMNTSIPTSEFTAGIYQVSITSATGTVSQKLIINH